MLITTKFRAPVGIRDLIIAETPLYCIIHYVKDTIGSPSNPGLVNEYSLNIIDKKLYKFDGSIWSEQIVLITDRFLFCKNGSVATGCGNNVADMTIYFISGAEYDNKYATDGIVVLVKNTSLGYKANSLITYDKTNNDWYVNEASDISNTSTNVFWSNPVISKNITDPPITPNVNDRYIIPLGATGIWTGQQNKIAEWDSSQWLYTLETQGLVAYVADEDKIYSCDGSAWSLLSGSVGTTDHALLSNLQGGVVSEYYHLTSAEQSILTGSKSNNLVLASPDGSAGNATFRSIVDTDLPPIDGGGF